MAVAKTGYIHRLCMESLHTDSFLREYRGHLSVWYAPALLRQHRSAHQPGPRLCSAAPWTLWAFPPERSTRPFCRGSCPLLRRCLRRPHPPAAAPPSAVGHPLAGDWSLRHRGPRLIPRPALHSYRLRLLHPVTRRWLDVTAPLPEDMRRLPRRTAIPRKLPACIAGRGSFSHPSSADGPYSIICRAKRCAFSRIPGRRTRLPRSLAVSSRQNRGGR